jgi:polyhydroxyalkanoate synthesis regulator phasin
MATKRTAGRTRGGGQGSRQRSRDGASTETVREQVRRLLNPVDAVVLTRERLQEVLDDAVDRGRMTRDDATQLLSDIVTRGRRQTDDLLRELETLVSAPAGRVLREVDRARRVTGLAPGAGVGGIAGYDDMTAAQVIERLDDLPPADLRLLRDHERRNANRKTVLAAVERKLR